MNVNFSFKGFELKLPAQKVYVKVEEISYGVEDANVIEIAQASKEIMSSALEMYREIEGAEAFSPIPSIDWDSINSGDEGLDVPKFELGDEVVVTVVDSERDAIVLAHDKDDNSYTLRVLSTPNRDGFQASYYEEDIKRKAMVEAEKVLNGENL
jgi:hypothetical protein